MQTAIRLKGATMFRLAVVAAFVLVAAFLPPSGIGRAQQSDDDLTEVMVYFLREGKVAAARRLVELDADKRVGQASILALIAGPNEEEQAAGLTSAIPPGTEFLGLTVDSETGLAILDLSDEFADPILSEESTPFGAEPPTARARLAQVVYTLTQFPTVSSVRLSLDGRPLDAFDLDGDGGEAPTDLSEGVDRADFEDVTPLIFVETPTVGETVSSPVRVAGTANTFEAVFFVQLRDADGDLLVEQQVMATSGSGTRGTFEVEIEVEIAEPGPGMLVAFDRSPRDGAIENAVEIPVEFVLSAES